MINESLNASLFRRYENIECKYLSPRSTNRRSAGNKRVVCIGWENGLMA